MLNFENNLEVMPKSKDTPGESDKIRKPHTIEDIDREYLSKIASKAKDLRKATGHSYESFALRSGINRNTYFKFENSSKSSANFTMALLLRVIRGLNLTPSEFFKLVE